MGKDILHRVGNGGHCGCETVSREVLPQVEIPEKWTQEPPCFAITIWCAIKIAHQWGWWSDDQISQHALLRCSGMETHTFFLSGIYATGLVKSTDKMDEICINGTFSAQEPREWKFFSPESRLISGLLELLQVRLFWKIITSRPWQLSHSCQTGVCEYFPSNLVLELWNMKM